MERAFIEESGFKSQFGQMLKEDLVKEVLRRKVTRFIKEGNGAPLTLQGVFVFDRKCNLNLRMEASRFAVQSPGEQELAQLRRTVALIHAMRNVQFDA